MDLRNGKRRQIGQDDPLGSVAIPITMTPSELKNLRFQLDRVASLGPWEDLCVLCSVG